MAIVSQRRNAPSRGAPALALAAVTVLAIATPEAVRSESGTAFNAYLLPPITIALINQTIPIEFSVDATGTQFNGYTVSITYDPSIVYLDGVDEGALMTDQCTNRFVHSRSQDGTFTYSHVVLCAGLSLDGPGTLSVYRFRAIADGTTTVRITSAPDCTFVDAGLCIGPLNGECPRGVLFHDALITVTDGVLELPGGSPEPPSVPFVAHSPNPSTGGGRFSFHIDGVGSAALELFDALGRRRVHRRIGSPTRGQITWDGRDDHGVALESGTYYARLARGDETATTSVVIAR